MHGFNIELNALMERYYEDAFGADVRIGYGFNLGKKCVITPQLGFGAYWGYSHEYGYYGYYGYYDSYPSIMAGCKIQYCLSKNLAIVLSLQEAISSGSFSSGGLRRDDYRFVYGFDNHVLPPIGIEIRYNLPLLNR